MKMDITIQFCGSICAPGCPRSDHDRIMFKGCCEPGRSFGDQGQAAQSHFPKKKKNESLVWCQIGLLLANKR